MNGLNRMLEKDKKITRAVRAPVVAVMLLLVTFLSSPVYAQATCETNDAAPDYAANTAVPNISQYIASMWGQVWVAEQLALTEIKAAGIDALDTMEENILERMNEVWPAWLEAWKGMTEQLSASVMDETRQVASLHDSSDIGSVSRQIQDKEVSAIKTYRPTEEGCEFDTTGPYRGRASSTGRAVSRAMTTNINKLGSNKAGTPAAQGAGAWQKSRYENYRANFCDSTANGGTGANCPDGALKNAHILPSKTIFGNETIDMSDPVVVNALNELTLNITGFEVPDPIDQEALKVPAGSEQRQLDREYQAQMDVTNGLVTSVIGERTPGSTAPQIQAKRLVADPNANATEKPSEREIRQGDIEQLWSPKYYAHLGGGPTTTTQKELYLRAMNLMMLYRLIEKTERISTSFSVQTGNLLKKTDHSRDGGSEYGSKR